MKHELEKAGCTVKKQAPLPMTYDDVRVDAGYRLDLVVDNKVIIEVKSVEAICEVHHKQLITYLKLSGMKPGILVNFNTTNIVGSTFRKVNGL